MVPLEATFMSCSCTIFCSPVVSSELSLLSQMLRVSWSPGWMIWVFAPWCPGSQRSRSCLPVPGQVATTGNSARFTR